MNLTRVNGTELRLLYEHMLYARMIEERMLLLLRQGKISKWFSGIGQEAISVGATLAMQQDEWIMPGHRNLGVFTSRGIPLHALIQQWQGMQQGFTQGRDRSFHFGTATYKICGMISHLASQLPVATGAALSHVLKNEKKAVLTFCGEGATSEGDFHEALNLAAVWNLPVIFLIENNGYALSTPVREQYRCINLVDKARGYGIDGALIDGNDASAVYSSIKKAREYCIQNQVPYLIEATTFRMRGHEEASGTFYVPKELFELWNKRDPLRITRQQLSIDGNMSDHDFETLQHTLQARIEVEELAGFENKHTIITPKSEEKSVYATPSANGLQVVEKTLPFAQAQSTASIRFIDAIRQGLEQALHTDSSVLLMGQDIAEYGGAFKITEGFVDIFGKSRIRNTPVCESAVLGAALGLTLEGYKPVVEMQFADFITCGFNQVVNNLAKIHYRWGHPAQVVIRMPCGGSTGAGPFHSQSNEAWFVHTPGLKIVYPSSPIDAKGLLLAAIHDPNPVLFFEHKALYRSLRGDVPIDPYEVPIGKAQVVQQGEDLSIITYGLGVIWAQELAVKLPQFSIEILDLRTLLPLDYNALSATVKKTGKVLVLHEDNLTGGIGAEVAAWIGEHCFLHLDAPVMRCASLDTPIPFNKELEENYLPVNRLQEVVYSLMNY